MAQEFQPGPIGVFLGPQNVLGPAGRFVGIGVMSPETDFQPKYKPVHSDFGGSQISTETSFAGEEAFVSIDFIRYDPLSLDLIANYLNSAADFANPGIVAGTRGKYLFGSIGTLMRTEEFHLTLFLLNTNMLPVGNPAGFPNQSPGWRFPCCECVQNTLPRKNMEDPQIARMAFQAHNLLDMSRGVPDWLLYDEQVANLPPMT